MATEEETGLNRPLKRLYGASAVAAPIAVAGIAASHVQDHAAVDPADVKVLTDNDKVRVLEVLRKSGAKEPMHSHPGYASVYLSASKVRVALPGGKVTEKDRKAGETQYSGPTTHTVKNVGTTDQHAVVIELKE